MKEGGMGVIDDFQAGYWPAFRNDSNEPGIASREAPPFPLLPPVKFFSSDF
jgi:hypothetical protein